MNPVSRNLNVASRLPEAGRGSAPGTDVADLSRRSLVPIMSSAALILHDDEQTSSLVRALLASAGYETASSPSAYRLLAAEIVAPPRLVLLGMSAVEDRDVELVSLLRRRWPDAWILALHPASLRERAAHALALGADACLQEPFYAGEILAIARRAAARGVAVAPAAPQTAPRADAATGAVEQLAAGVAHMVRNPLQILELQIASAEADGALDVPGMREQVRRIEGVVEELARCAGRRELPLEPVDVVELADRVFPHERKKEKGARPLVVRHADPKAEALASPDLLRAALDTLRRRAERVTPGDSPIEVRTQIRTEGRRRTFEISVTDGGPALSDERRARLFEPFPDAEAVQDGTGLELAAAAGIVRDHGGSATAHAAAGGGTTIVVRLPLRDAAAKAKDR